MSPRVSVPKGRIAPPRDGAAGGGPPPGTEKLVLATKLAFYDPVAELRRSGLARLDEDRRRRGVR